MTEQNVHNESVMCCVVVDVDWCVMQPSHW